MVSFAIGASIPLVVIGLASRQALMRWRDRLLASGSGAKVIFGGTLIAIAFLILTGYDKVFEARLVNTSPTWLTNLTTRY